MKRTSLVLSLALSLTGCPDVEKYATDAELPPLDLAMVLDAGGLQDVGRSDGQLVDSSDLGAPDVGPTDASLFDAENASDDASLRSDSGIELDQGLVSVDQGTIVPEECEVTFLATLPVSTTEDAEIFIAGQGLGVAEWEPDLVDLRMTRSDGSAQLVVTLGHLSRVTYKYTRGGWPTVESTLQCAEIDNRSVVVDCAGGSVLIQDVILGWTDGCL